MWLNILRWEIILDYPSKPSKKDAGKSDSEEIWQQKKSWEVGAPRWGASGSWKSKELASPLELLEGTQPSGHLDLQTVR